MNCGELADFGLNSICKSRWNANWTLAPKWIAQEHILNDIAASVEQEVQAHAEGNMLTIAEESIKPDQESSDETEISPEEQQNQQQQLLVPSSASSLIVQQQEQSVLPSAQQQLLDQQQGIGGNSVFVDYNFTTLLQQALTSIDDKARREKIQVIKDIIFRV